METSPKQASPCNFVIFGASGDLTKRLLVPALYHLRRARLLPDGFSLIGVARTPESDEQFRERLGKSLRDLTHEDIDAADWEWLAQRMHYITGNLDDPATYTKLKAALDKSADAHGSSGNHLFYLAVPASAFGPVAKQLGDAGLTRETDKQWRRLVIEKPFGSDLKSAKALNATLLRVMDESQIYRIDHYLGKETVQNIMVLRFGNGLFEPLWNRNHIDHVEITVAETLGVERRGRYYDATGALRDMVPNHLFQLLTLTAMEPPNCFDTDALRNEKGKVLDAVRRLTPDMARRDAVRAQYGAGVAGGTQMKAYRNEPDVDPKSRTETYTALKLEIDNWRWVGVPFYLRTGKALTSRKSRIVIQFKQAPLTLFRDTPVDSLTPNDLTMRIQPEEGIFLRFGAKIPGPQMRIGDVEMRFLYSDYFKSTPSNGYETLLYDCMIGDQTLFQRADTIESAWSIIQPVLDLWAADRDTPIPVYPAGSTGPEEADALLKQDGRYWRPLDATPDTPK